MKVEDIRIQFIENNHGYSDAYKSLLSNIAMIGSSVATNVEGQQDELLETIRCFSLAADKLEESAMWLNKAFVLVENNLELKEQKGTLDVEIPDQPEQPDQDTNG